MDPDRQKIAERSGLSEMGKIDLNEFVKSLKRPFSVIQTMISFVGASGRTPIFGRAPARPYNARRAKTEE